MLLIFLFHIIFQCQHIFSVTFSFFHALYLVVCPPFPLPLTSAGVHRRRQGRVLPFCMAAETREPPGGGGG